MDTQDNPVEPTLNDRSPKPRGVLHKNAKILVYMGTVVVLILAMIFGNTKKKPAAKAAAAPPPVVETNTDNNVAALHAQVATDRQAKAQQTPMLPQDPAAQQAGAGAYGLTGQPLSPQAPGMAPGQTAQVQTGTSSGTMSPGQQEAQQLATKERERQYAARFESNIAYSYAAPAQEQVAAGAQPGTPSNLTPARPAANGEDTTADSGKDKRAPEINVDSAAGQPYVIYEGTTLDTVLMNRLDGDSVGAVKVLVSNPVYSHDHQHVLIPDGAIVLGEARKIGGGGFGQQRRIAVVFHRLIMPDGYSVDLDQFHGLDQIGEEALKDKVNNHYLEIFGTSIALGVISGAAQITQGGTGFNSSGSQSFVTGASSGISQQATTVLDKFIQIPPTITIREGHRVKVYISQDMLLPAYTNHTIPQTF